MAGSDELLAQGIAAAKAGQRDAARQLFQTLLRQDPRSELGWLWLSGLLDAPAQKRDCLQRVLAINPHNELALRGLQQLAQSEAASFLATFEPHQPSAPKTIAPPASEVQAPLPLPITLAAPAPVPVAAAQVQETAPATAAPAVVDLPPPSDVVDAPCVFCGAPTGPSGECAACGMEQIFDCPECGRHIDLREHMVCECGFDMKVFIVNGQLRREQLGDLYRDRDYPAAAVKQWKAALDSSSRSADLHRKIAAIYLDLGLIEQARKHNDLSKKR